MLLLPQETKTMDSSNLIEIRCDLERPPKNTGRKHKEINQEKTVKQMPYILFPLHGGGSETRQQMSQLVS